MTNDKQIEVWRAEFWGLVEKSPDSIRNSEYNMIRLEGYLMSKRSLPPIELPHENFLAGSHGQVDAIYFCNQIKEAITSAGYSYRVKE